MFIKNLKPLTNYDIINLANELKISNFRGVFMKDTLPSKINKIECGIMNLKSNEDFRFNNNSVHTHAASIHRFLLAKHLLCRHLIRIAF